MRGGQLSRQWRVLRAIESSRLGLTAAQIADVGGVSLRTAYRDLDDLQLAGFPLYTEESGVRHWKLVGAFRSKIPAPFTVTEMISLLLARDLFAVFAGTVFFDSLQALGDKIRSALPPQALAYVEQLQGVFRAGIRPYRNYGRYREMIQQVNRAVTASRRIEIVYHGLRRETETRRLVDPYRVWFYDGTIYLIGLCRLREEVRMFVLDRIRLLRLTDETFTRPANLNLDALTRQSFRVMQDELYTVRVHISKGWARYVAERTWHESQVIQKQIDGAIEIAFRVAGLEEIKLWVLSLGPEARVIEPPELAFVVARSLKQTLTHYEGLEVEPEPVKPGPEPRFEEMRLWR